MTQTPKHPIGETVGPSHVTAHSRPAQAPSNRYLPMKRRSRNLVALSTALACLVALASNPPALSQGGPQGRGGGAHRSPGHRPSMGMPGSGHQPSVSRARPTGPAAGSRPPGRPSISSAAGRPQPKPPVNRPSMGGVAPLPPQRSGGPATPRPGAPGAPRPGPDTAAGKRPGPPSAARPPQSPVVPRTPPTRPGTGTRPELTRPSPPGSRPDSGGRGRPSLGSIASDATMHRPLPIRPGDRPGMPGPPTCAAAS